MIDNFYNGTKISINDQLMSETIEDWSKIRSPSRAKRRMKRGYKQNISFKIIPKEDIIVLKDQNLMVMHSQTLNKLQTEIAKKEETRVQRAYL